jgi:hypothetical protein
MFCLFIYSVYGQQYTPAVLINKEGDSVRCEIAYKRWDKNPRSIKVRGTSKSLYLPGDIKGFTVAKESYVSAFVDVEISPYKLDQLEDNANYKYRSDTVFLQQLVGGSRSLYFLQDQDGKKHFYIYDGKFVHLDYKQYKRKDDTKSINAKSVVASRKYLGQLTNYLNCPGIQDRIAKVQYEAGALTKLFMKYYECNGGEKGVVKPRHEMAAEMGVLAGGNMTTLKFLGGSAYQFLPKTDFDASFGPVIGLFVDLKMLRSRGSRITNDIMYTGFDISGTGHGGGNGTVAYNTTSRFKYQYVKTQHAFQYAVAPDGKLYVSGGITFGFVISEEHQLEIDYETGIKNNPTFRSGSFEYGVVGSVGSNFGRFAVDARYEWSSSLTYENSLTGNLGRVYVLAKYRLKYKPRL